MSFWARSSCEESFEFYCFQKIQCSSLALILYSSFPPPFITMYEHEKSRRSSPARAISSRSSARDLPETTRPNSLDEKNDGDQNSRNSSPEDAGGRELSSPPSPLDANGRRELKEWECWDKLAYSWPKWKKAMYLASIAGIQISMNFNTSVYPSAVKPLVAHFGISEQQARVGQMIYRPLTI